jgi:hypothetical protein
LSDVWFAKLLNDGVIERQDRATGYNLTTVRLGLFKALFKAGTSPAMTREQA